MRFELVIATTILFTITASQSVSRQQQQQQQQQPPPLQHPSFPDVEINLPNALSEHDRLRRRVDLAFEWDKAWCRGAKLAQAMIKSEAQAAAYLDPARSPWDGNLVAAFRTWGYSEIPHHRDDLCDFGAGQHDLQRAFADMKIGTGSSANGGPNICYHVEHQNGPTVERDSSGQYPPVHRQYYSAGGRKLRETQAYTTLGINPVSGVIYFLNRLSPREAAHESWNIPLKDIKSSFLPDLSASSDHAWGFWNRAMEGGDLSKINKIFVCMITNEVTQALIAETLRTYPLPPGVDPLHRPRGVEKWPGTSFEMYYDAAQVLLGSPNGQAVGYFLAQHKHRFGRSQTVGKVTVFRADVGFMPYIMFDVIDAPDGPTRSDADEQEDGEAPGLGRDDRNRTETNVEHTKEERIVRRSMDEKNVLREHIFRAML